MEKDMFFKKSLRVLNLVLFFSLGPYSISTLADDTDPQYIIEIMVVAHQPYFGSSTIPHEAGYERYFLPSAKRRLVSPSDLIQDTVNGDMLASTEAMDKETAREEGESGSGEQTELATSLPQDAEGERLDSAQLETPVTSEPTVNKLDDTNVVADKSGEEVSAIQDAATRIDALDQHFWQLKNLHKRLDNHPDEYRVLLHTSWVDALKPGQSEFKHDLNFASETESGLLKDAQKAFQTLKNGLETTQGYMRYRLGQYFDVEGDLIVQSSYQQLYHLKLKRRMKLKQIHYFDHPGFGVFVYIAPFSDLMHNTL